MAIYHGSKRITVHFGGKEILNGYKGASLIYRNKEKYIYSGYGTLAEGVTLSGMEERSDNGGGLYRAVFNNTVGLRTTATFKLCDVDLTDFNTLRITNGGFGTYNDEPDQHALWFGNDSQIYWGIDSANSSSTLLADNSAYGVYGAYNKFTAEIDVSGYTGTHDIIFYAELRCSHRMVEERVALYLQEVKLHN